MKKILSKFSIFSKKNENEINKIYDLKFNSAKNLIAKDRVRYLKEYNTENCIKYINNHFDKLQEELILIDYKKDLNKIEFFSGEFIMKDSKLFTHLETQASESYNIIKA